MPRRMLFPLLALMVVAALLAPCACDGGDDHGQPPPAKPQGGLVFAYVDVASAMGFKVRNRSGKDSRKEFILEAMPPGIAVADFDGDGWLDLYCPNGNNITSYDKKTSTWTLLDPAHAPRNELYWNKAGQKFVEGGKAAGVDDDSWSFGAIAGDVDNDGDKDLFLCNWGPNRLFLNDGRGKFREVARSMGADGNPRDWSCGACFVDYDGDGDLDVYVAQYLDMDDAGRSNNIQVGADGKPFGRQCDFRGIPVYCGPLGLLPLNDQLLQNQLVETGKLAFKDVSKEAGILLALSKHARNESSRGPFFGFQPVAWDINGDGLQDIFVANDSVANLAWINQGDGTFKDEASTLSLARSQRDFAAQATMGVAVGDVNRDGLFDVTITEFSHDHFNLMVCKPIDGGQVVFNERAVTRGLRQMTFAKLGWGAEFFDPDLDGDEDIFYACGHVYPEVDSAPGTGTTYRQTNLLILNENPGRMRFRDVSSVAGPGLALQRPSRASVRLDFDNDGDPDLALIELNDFASLLRCDLGPEGAARHWLGVEVVGDPAKRVPLDAAGAVVTVVAGEITQKKVYLIGSSFLSSEDPRLAFGLGSHARAERVEVLWTNGETTVLTDVAADQFLRVRLTP